MIIEVSREYGSHVYDVTPLEDDRTPKLNKIGKPVERTGCVCGVVWDMVGELVTSYGPEQPVTIVYRDDNSLTERVRRAQQVRPS